ncbi:hypothetical protein LGM35_32890 [Burkholderia cenocepacia]|uniref:hypothetical protein n=1 Tax=Burkholderia cenocepacia TaxID=95486 RepID=UPI001CF5545A|nr:hypothetical protein [Burkholderia cenocepacia]MCA7927323.1 hypothetical protein [Burkholderia cenocepacia]
MYEILFVFRMRMKIITFLVFFQFFRYLLRNRWKLSSEPWGGAEGSGGCKGDAVFTKNIVVLILVVGIVLGCATKPTSELPIRSPHQFLSDVKAVADSGDLENVEFVSKLLRVDYQRNSKVPVIEEDGRSVKGYSINVTRYAFSKEYDQDRKFNYDIFQHKGGDFYEISISFPVNYGVICIAPYDFIDVFDGADGYPTVDIRTLEYVRDNQGAKTRITFYVSGTGCVSRVGICKNRENP